MKQLVSRVNRVRVCWTMLLVISSLAIPACADPVSPTARERRITMTVSSLLRQAHLSRHPLDDEISERCLTTFVKMLDPAKVYFYQTDIDAFMQHRYSLDDRILAGDVDFAYQVFDTFLKRVDERVLLVDEFLKAEHDFTLEEEIVVDRDVMVPAKTLTEARTRWRKRIKFDLLLLKSDEITGTEATDKLSRRYHSFSKRMHQTDSEELLEIYLTALTTSFDPHTTYMSPNTYENFLIQMQLRLEGIGAALQGEDGYTVVKRIIRKGPADKHGVLEVEDKIVGVGQGVDAPIEDVVDMKLGDVVKRIRGRAGSVVRLELLSGDGTERKTIAITRGKVELTDQEAQAEVFPVGQREDGEPYKIGVIELPSFYMDMRAAKRGVPEFKSTTRDVRNILTNFRAQGVDAVVLDLRHNGGGSLQEAINLTGLFIDTGPVVQVKDSDGDVMPYNDLDSGVAWNGPLVVLVSKFSASASEILAGAIQDYRRGLLVGDKATHGKGTVQSLKDLGEQLFRLPNSPRLGALKITEQQFYRPSGQSTQKRGVEADIDLPSISAHMDVGEADLDYPIEFDEVDTAGFKPLNYVDQVTVDRLRSLSEARLKNSEDFQDLVQLIERFVERKDCPTRTLNEKRFLAELAELNSDKEEREEIEKTVDPTETGIHRDFYLDEALAITLDYLRLHLLALRH